MRSRSIVAENIDAFKFLFADKPPSVLAYMAQMIVPAIIAQTNAP